MGEKMRKIELLCPASSLEVLKIAVIYGADAVYIGGEAFGLRAKAKNFSMEEMAEGVAFAHAHGVRVYVTANILAHNYDLDGVREYFTELHNMKPDRPDALIIADPAVFMIAKEVCPEIERHVSTQANNTNYGTYQFWWNLGASRVVTARELSLKEIKEIRGHIDDRMEIETFVHGAMCISYSGRCLLSNYFTGRDANKGACTHPCRWKYSVVEEKRPGADLHVVEPGVADLRRQLPATVLKIGHGRQRGGTIDPAERFADAGFGVQVVFPRIRTAIARLGDLACLGFQRWRRPIRQRRIEEGVIVVKFAGIVAITVAVVLDDTGYLTLREVAQAKQP